MDKEEMFVNWLCGKKEAKFPFFCQEDMPQIPEVYTKVGSEPELTAVQELSLEAQTVDYELEKKGEHETAVADCEDETEPFFPED